MARLTTEQWEKVRADWCTGAYTYQSLSDFHGVSDAAIIKRKTKEGWERLDQFVKVEPGSSGFIYIVTFLDSANKKHYKIGMAKNIEQRLQGLQTGNPFKLKIELCFFVNSMSEAENKIHLEFKDRRTNGEWFELTDNDVSYIAKRYSVNG